MISLTAITGPYAGQTREAKDVLPEDILGDFLIQGWEWSIDYSQGTEEEKFLWFRQDLSCRIVKAIKEGRSVSFLGKMYRVEAGYSADELIRAVGEIEDAIANSGRMVSIEYDDRTGLAISDGGFVS